ncbi:MAG: CPBP family glutamic-type intramembrane protease [Thermoguttaceae bacterium]
MSKMDGKLQNASPSREVERYWLESRRPLESLAFIAPLLIVYEAGVLWLGAQNGADAFMRWVLQMLGFGQHFVLPVLMICVLLAWHHVARQYWRLSGSVLSRMAAESVCLGLCLCVFCLVWNSSPSASVGETMRQGVGPLLALLGAGIYEELLFRLILLSLSVWALRRMGMTPRAGMLVAVIANGLLFAAAHHMGPYGEHPLLINRFLFRALAGAFFSAIFIYRGFGIAAGSHAAYDVLVSVL